MEVVNPASYLLRIIHCKCGRKISTPLENNWSNLMLCNVDIIGYYNQIVPARRVRSRRLPACRWCWSQSASDWWRKRSLPHTCKHSTQRCLHWTGTFYVSGTSDSWTTLHRCSNGATAMKWYTHTIQNELRKHQLQLNEIINKRTQFLIHRLRQENFNHNLIW